MSKQRTDSKEIKEKCGICSKAGAGSWISCEICEVRFHPKCVGITEEAYKGLKDVQACHWFCQACDSKLSKLIPSIVSVHARMDYLEEKMDKDIQKIKSDVNEIKHNNESKLNKMSEEMDKYISDLHGNVDDVTRRLKEQVVTDIQSNDWSDIVKRQVDESLESVADNLQQVKRSIRETTEKAEEQRDKESRQNNIVLYNVPENDEPRSEANKADIAFCLQLFNNCLNTGTTEEDFVSVFRLGKKVI